MKVYFIGLEGHTAIKIGFTANNDVSVRLRQLQTGQPQKLYLIGTIDGDRSVEQTLHKELAALRRNGEWFDGGAGLRHLVEHIIATGEWYACRGPRLLGYQWVWAFSDAENDDPQISCNEAEIKFAERQLKGFRKQAEKFFGRYGYWPYRGNGPAANIFKIIDRVKNQAALNAAKYLLAWQGIEVLV